MATLIQRLIDRGHAYETNGEVLFDTASMADYGQLSKRNLDEQQAGARIAVDAHKKNPQDFVLWKQSSAEEPGWDAAFRFSDGSTRAIRGRPGWHIECSAMSAAYLGEVFDIHGGGLDLIFPHHENEIAQSRCAHGTQTMANVWMHNGFLQVEGRKMSKSDGNFVTINELLETEKFGGRKWPGEVLRLAMLMTHYRQPIDFSVSRLQEAGSIVSRWADAQMSINEKFGTEIAAWRLELRPEFPLLDDLNVTPLIGELHHLATRGTGGDRDAAAAFSVALDLLGFENLEWLSQSVRDTAVPLGMSESELAGFNDSVNKRLALIAAKNWPEADRIRDELLAQGIQLKDGKDPVTGERVTTWEVKR